MKTVRFTGILLSIGAVALLAGCVGVPTGPVYSNGGYDAGYSSGGYAPGYGGYATPYYADPAPIVVAPPVYIQGGGYYGRPGYDPRRRDYRDTRPGWNQRDTRPGWNQRPGFVPGGVARPDVRPSRPGVVPHAPTAAPGVFITPNEAIRQQSRAQHERIFGKPAPAKPGDLP